MFITVIYHGLCQLLILMRSVSANSNIRLLIDGLERYSSHYDEQIINRRRLINVENSHNTRNPKYSRDIKLYIWNKQKNMTFVTYNTVCCLQVVIVILLEKYASLGVAVLLPDMGVVSEKMQILCPHTEKSRRFPESQKYFFASAQITV